MWDTVTTTMQATTVTDKKRTTGIMVSSLVVIIIIAMIFFWLFRYRHQNSRARYPMATRSQSGYTSVPLTSHDRKNDSGTNSAKKSVGNIVKLDVGGTIFKTSKATLTKFSGFFRALMEIDIPSTEDESGAIFIDRDPAHFRLILNFMRDGHVDLPESSEDVKQIRNEAEYYQLDGLLELCEKRVPGKLNFIKTNEELLQLVASIENRPLVVVDCSTGHRGKLYFPDDFQCGNFVQEFQDRYDIYFRSNVALDGSWCLQVFDVTHKCVITHDIPYDDEFDKCIWRLRNNLAPFPEEQREDRLHNV